MQPFLENRRGRLADVHEVLGRTLAGVGLVDEDRLSLPTAIGRALGAEWLAHRSGRGEWIAVGPSGVRAGPFAERTAHRLDFSLLARLPRSRIVRLSGPALDRRPRLAGNELREVVVYVDSSAALPAGIVAIGLARPLAVDPRELEFVLRSWLALDALRSRTCREIEDERLADVGRRAACILHDLRHELTVAGLELERAVHEPASLCEGTFDRLAGAIAAARALCESGLAPDSRTEAAPCLVVGLLRTEALAAQAVAGRGNAVQVEVSCDENLEVRVERQSLSRIVRNLVLNAVESSPDGSCVSLQAEMSSGAELVLRVIDHGRGMSAADREGWRRFGQSGRGGQGIGTASIESCARRIGAWPRFDSRPGWGTTVELRIPPAARRTGG